MERYLSPGLCSKEASSYDPSLIDIVLGIASHSNIRPDGHIGFTVRQFAPGAPLACLHLASRAEYHRMLASYIK